MRLAIFNMYYLSFVVACFTETYIVA